MRCRSFGVDSVVSIFSTGVRVVCGILVVFVPFSSALRILR